MLSFDEITVSPGLPLVGTCSLPGDKSISHRYALFTAMAQGRSVIENFLAAGVTEVMLTVLKQMGVVYQFNSDTLVVDSPGLMDWNPPSAHLDCGNSATTMRLLAGALSAGGIPAVLDGSPGLRRRPMGRIVEPLRLMGVTIEAGENNCAPISIHGRSKNQALRPMNYTLPVASAQVKSCLLIAALAADGPTMLSEPGPSRDHTERLLNSLGIHVDCQQNNGEFLIRIDPPERLQFGPLILLIPGDISSAAFLIVASLITPGSHLTLKNVGLNPTRTGLLDVLHDMGADIAIYPSSEQGGEPVGDLVVRHSSLQPVTVHGNMVPRMIDEFPAFAIAAAYAEGDTVVRDAQELRLKESDRISFLVRELNQLGIKAEESTDGFIIHGGKLPAGGRANAHGDHRLAMALALAGLSGTAPVTIIGANVIRESFPQFPQVLRALGADIDMAEQND